MSYMSEYTSPTDEAFFGAIGRLTISWAHLEFGLDCMVEIVHHHFGGEEVEAEMASDCAPMTPAQLRSITSDEQWRERNRDV